MDVHVSWSLVGLNRTAEAASRTNQTDQIAKAGEARDAAEDELEAWFSANGGKYLSGGEPGRATFVLDHLEDFRKFLDQLRQTYGAVAAGIGLDSKEADQALQVSQTRGSKVEVVWSPDHADEIRKSLLEDFMADFPTTSGPEALEKKISGISPGTLIEPDTYDYNHVLPQGHRDAGYSMSVVHLPWKDEEEPGSTHFDTVLHHQGQEVGSVSSRVRDGALHIDNTTINGKLDPSGAFAHRGKRLGVSMYAATMAHSHHLLGAKRTLGGVHSTSASRTHQSLARDHGLDYRPVKIDDNPVGDKDANYGPYEYTLKSELVKAENASRDAPAAIPEQPSTSSVPQTFEQQFHAAAQAQEQVDRTQAQQAEVQRGQLLGQVAQVLRMVQRQAPRLEELRQAAPEVYQAVKAMAQAVAQMAQGLRGDGESMRKTEGWLARPPLYVMTAKDVVDSEQLDKNLSSIAPGKPLPQTSLLNAKEYDYSHLLPESQRHMKLVVRDHGLAVGRKTDAYPHYTAHVLDDSGEAGSVQAHLYDGFVGRRHMEIHAPFGLVREYQGRGLGSAMYEALQAHGVQKGGVTHVTGGGHTNSAGKVHERLAARHGFRYRPGKGGEYNDRGPYKYAVKAMVEQFDLAKGRFDPEAPSGLYKAFGGLPMPRPRRRVNLHLPVGTWDATTGRIKIRKPDGSEVWHQAKVGLIASSSPATAGADFGNPTSARNPSG